MHIVHLVDDASPGGVVRFLSRLATAAELPEQAIVPVKRGRWSAPDLDACVIVSHLSVSWRNLPMLMAIRAKYPGTPLIHVEHSYSPAFVDLHVRRQERFLTLLRVVYALFDKVVAVSETQAAWMRDKLLVPEHALASIPPVTDLSRFLSVPALSYPVRRFGGIGRLDPQKGFDVLIEAFKLSKGADLRLQIFGDGPDRERLYALAADDGRISFRGFVDPVAAMSECDAIAMPSRYEPFGLVALEGRAAGRLTMTSGVDGLADQAAEGAVRSAREFRDQGGCRVWTRTRRPNRGPFKHVTGESH